MKLDGKQQTMFKNFFILLVLALSWAANYAQHCAYDNAFVIGAHVYYGDTANRINHLKITLVDEWLRPISHITEPILTQRSYSNSTNLQDHYFAFAPNDYLFAFYTYSRSADFFYLKVEDLDGPANLGFFETQYFKIPQNAVLGLCSYSHDSYAKQQQEYKPIPINLAAGSAIQQQVEVHQQFIFKTNYSINRSICAALNCYGFQLTVYNTATRQIEFDSVFTGQVTNGVLWQPFEVQDYNYDQVPDFKLFTNGTTYQPYFFYNPKTRKFEQHQQLSNCYSVSFNDRGKSITGRSAVKPSLLPNYSHQYNEYTYYGPGFLASSAKTYYWQAWSNHFKVELLDSVAPIVKSIENYSVQPQLPKPLLNVQKEFIDFNFDGHNDCKVMNPKATYGHQIYLFNPEQNTYLYDSLLSNIAIIKVNPSQKEFLGSISVQVDNVTHETLYYTYYNNTIMPTKRVMRIQSFVGSERTDTEVYELRNNAWVLTEFIQGAE